MHNNMLSKRLWFTFNQYSWFVLLANLGVILWGGFVSASGSGDGCGDQWPLCAEAAERTTTQFETWVELSHRITSGMALLLVLFMLIWAFQLYKRTHPVRRMAIWSMVFMLGEAAIGAIIVLQGYVAENDSLIRAFTQPLHLVNTYLLIGALGLTAWYATGRQSVNLLTNRWLCITFASVLLLSAFGTIASLATTIFPSQTFVEGIQKDFSQNAHYLVRLRILHPIIAVLVGLLLYRLTQHWKNKWGDITLILFGTQFGLGIVNAILVAPIIVQLAHLLLSDLLWLSLIFFGATHLQNITTPTSTHKQR